MRLGELLSEVAVLENRADTNAEITGVYNDSRKVKPGGLFVAVSGDKTDGHRFIKDAINNGACAVICERPPERGIPFALVGDSRAALFPLAAKFMGNPSRRMVMTGVTGTNGKTTVTHLIYGLLKAAGKRPALIGTNHVLYADKTLPAERTTPDAAELHTLFRDMADAGCTHCVMEVSSHALEQSRAAGIGFEVGVFTNLTQDHLDYHKNMENYFLAKTKLFKQCKYSIVNIDDNYGKRLEKEDIYSYAVNARANLRARDIKIAADGVSITLDAEGERCETRWGTPGLFSVYNVLAAAAAALKLGLSLSAIARCLPNIPPVSGRMETVPVKADFGVIIDYAHTPDALENVLGTVRGFTAGRVIAVFGCGGDRDAEKRPLMGAIAARLGDICVVTSDNPRGEDPEKIIRDILSGMPDASPVVEPDRRAALHKALGLAQKGDIVVICGKGHEMYQEIGGVKYPMDEREIVASYFKTKC
ncbi:MAG: UDP-N-acetylmuramoyl-L-alanyl-D-glutamate--2,6-diaminopimelate ligase [Oscillospiraceae bacterium]|nr:UDP-N-acetylmuramoyl-L-alanyl-D-glutamate--2,6-diaminopimelate ligase [Oscillospiraceae bacterium]